MPAKLDPMPVELQCIDNGHHITRTVMCWVQYSEEGGDPIRWEPDTLDGVRCWCGSLVDVAK